MENAEELDIHPSLREGFVPLPSDPSVPLTPEQLKALFPHPEVWREVIARLLEDEDVRARLRAEQDNRTGEVDGSG